MVIARVIAVILVICAATELLAQTPLRTFATRSYSSERDTLGRSDARWAYHYNDAGELDSLDVYYYDGEDLHLGGLIHYRRFMPSLVDWDRLPPNTNPPERLEEQETRVLVSRTPGLIELHRYIEDDPTGTRISRFEFDPSSGRLIADQSYKYVYEDSNGSLRRMKAFELKRPYKQGLEWVFYRDTDNTIIGMEQWKRVLGRGDTLFAVRLLQVLSWRHHFSWESVDPKGDYERDEFPYLPEGEPAVWDEYRKRPSARGDWGPSKKVERRFDSLGRFVASYNRGSSTTIAYANDASVRSIEIDAGTSSYGKATVQTRRFYGPDSVVWMDEVSDNRGQISIERTYRFTYEIGYRYPDLKGDRLSPLLSFSNRRDSLWLSIDSSIALSELSASIIDQRGKTVLPLKLRREFATPLHSLRPDLYAVRWKFLGRPVMDQVIDVR